MSFREETKISRSFEGVRGLGGLGSAMSSILKGIKAGEDKADGNEETIVYLNGT